ncbi:MAG: caspase family protein, partial [Pseudomonadota bacterium]
AVRQRLDVIAGQLHEDEALVVFFAGHSYYHAEGRELLLLPQDTVIPDGATTLGANETVLPFDTLFAAFSRDHRIFFVGDGCNFGAGLSDETERDLPHLSVMGSARIDQEALDGSPETGHSPFALAFAGAVERLATDLDRDGVLNPDELYHAVFPVVAADGYQHPQLFGALSHRLDLMRPPPEAPGVEAVVAAGLPVEGEVPPDLIGMTMLEINGVAATDATFAPGEKGVRLTLGSGTADLLRDGVNYFRGLRREARFWYENRRLSRYEAPYGESHALLFAIDDYDRAGTGGTPTGLAPLSNMVARAEELATVLRGRGFDRVRVIGDEGATSEAIAALLEEYWAGGRFAGVDRLVIYFAGHGVTMNGQTLLATYDYHPERRAQSSIHALDLVRKHFEFIAADHVLVLLDVCHAGLAVYATLSDDALAAPAGDGPAALDRLARVRDDTEGRSRNMLVAGTGNEEALWLNGGIFTQALIEALRPGSDADANNDGITQFHEYANHVLHEVSSYALYTGFRQKPSFKVFRHMGDGRVLFD